MSETVDAWIVGQHDVPTRRPAATSWGAPSWCMTVTRANRPDEPRSVRPRVRVAL